MAAARAKTQAGTSATVKTDTATLVGKRDAVDNKEHANPSLWSNSAAMGAMMNKRYLLLPAGCCVVLLVVATVFKQGWNMLFENPTGEIESNSWSASEASKRGTLVCRVNVKPSEILWKGKRIRFKEAWLEERFLDSHVLVWFPYAKRVGGMNLCFTLEGGQNLSDLGLSGWFVLEDSGSSFGELVAFGGPTIFSRQVDSPNFAQLRASLLDAWNQPRLKDIIFVKEKEDK